MRKPEYPASGNRPVIFVRLLAVFLFFSAGTSLTAQMRGYEVGAWVGGSNYFGDLNTNWRVNRTQVAAGIGARYNFNDRLGLKLGMNYGRIKASDADSRNIYEQRRNLSFRSLLFDANLLFEFNFMSYVHGHPDYWFTPYVFAGPSVFYFNPQAELDGTWYNLQEFGTEGQFRGEEYNSIQGAFVYGMGFKVDLSYRWSLDIQMSGRKLFTDYLDDVSGVYPDLRDVRAQRGDVAALLSDRSEEPRIGEVGRQRGNGKKNDTYVMLGIGLNYYFGQIRCPEFLRQ